jgi:hypothetical protein
MKEMATIGAPKDMPFEVKRMVYWAMLWSVAEPLSA